MSWKENKAVRLFTPAQAGLDNKPDINDLLLLGVGDGYRRRRRAANSCA